MKVGVIVGSVREGRLGANIGEWVVAEAPQLDGVELELIDLKSYDLPLMTSPVPPMGLNKHYDDERVTAWSQAVDACDAFVFVTPEYNHGVPGAFKNAVDWLGPEWWGKAVAFVGYGAGGGVRSVEQWRQILANFNMYDVRDAVQLNIFTDVTDGRVTLPEAREGELSATLERVVETARKLA